MTGNAQCQDDEYAETGNGKEICTVIQLYDATSIYVPVMCSHHTACVPFLIENTV